MRSRASNLPIVSCARVSGSVYYYMGMGRGSGTEGARVGGRMEAPGSIEGWGYERYM